MPRVTCDVQICRCPLGWLLGVQGTKQLASHRQPLFTPSLPPLADPPPPLPGEFITISPEIAACCTCPELLRACLLYINDYGGSLLSDDARAMLEPLRQWCRRGGGAVCAAASMDVWALAVVAFELLRGPGGEGGLALFGGKMEVRAL